MATLWSTTTLTLSNSGNSTLTWSGLSFDALLDSGGGIFYAYPATGTVVAGGSASVTLSFQPIRTWRYRSTLTVISDATSGTNTSTVSGTGTAATRIIWLSGNLAFGNVQVGTSATRTLTINNSGNSTLTVSGINTGNGVFTVSQTSGTVAAGGSGTVTLTFTPSAATSYSSTLTVISDATSGTNTSTVSGTGT